MYGKFAIIHYVGVYSCSTDWNVYNNRELAGGCLSPIFLGKLVDSASSHAFDRRGLALVDDLKFAHVASLTDRTPPSLSGNVGSNPTRLHGWVINLEEYSSGRRGRSAKAIGRVIGAGVRISPPPPYIVTV